MFGSFSHSISCRPFVSPSRSRFRVPILPRSVRSCDCPSRSPIRKWRVSCFRREEISPENVKPEVVEEIVAEELVRSNLEKTRVLNKSWASNAGEAVVSVLRTIATPWSVRWTGVTILQVMLLWVASFWFVGSWAIPLTTHIVGLNKDSLTHRAQALYSLLTDLTEGLAGIAILSHCLSRFRPLPPNWFNLTLNGNWHTDVFLGCLTFPLVNRLSQFSLDLFPLLPSTQVALSSVEQSILVQDPIAMGLYAVVVSVCAPIWEEILFRGFLLPSLTRYMPVWGSILVSSVVFGLAHFSVHRMLPLVLLGVVMRVVLARSRNLLPCIVLHSLWNGFVFLDLMK